MHLSNLCVQAIKAKESYRGIFLIKQFRYKFRNRKEMQVSHTSQHVPKMTSFPFFQPKISFSVLNISSKIFASREASPEHLCPSHLPTNDFWQLVHTSFGTLSSFIIIYLLFSLPVLRVCILVFKSKHQYIICVTKHSTERFCLLTTKTKIEKDDPEFVKVH